MSSVGTAIIISSLIGAGASAYSANQARKNSGGGGGRFGPITGQGTAEGLEQYIGSKMKNTATPYAGPLTTTQPSVESASQNTILGKLGNLPTAQDYKAKVEASKTQQIANEMKRASAQKEEESNMYNRLGLVSSTPWMTRAGELGDESLSRQKDIETGMDIYGLDYGLNAEKAMSDIANQWTTQGTVLGNQQRGYESQGISNLYNDFLRTTPENSPWLNKNMDLLSILGGGGGVSGGGGSSGGANALSGGANDLGSILALMSILGQGNKTPTGGIAQGTPSSSGGVNYNMPQYRPTGY